jgi:predicted aldo/keto reductase-like oxidoreductase
VKPEARTENYYCEENAMKDSSNRLNRRNFFKTVGVAGLSSVVGSKLMAEPNEPNTPVSSQPSETPQVPRRKFGKTGQDVPALSLGAIQLVDNQVILTSSLKWGIDYWDTAPVYTGGNSEICIGKYFAANPDMRKKVFLVTKASRANNPQQAEETLKESLKTMNTDYVDVFYGIHGLNNASQLTDEYKTWVEDAKKRGLFKYFGFSTHRNMAQQLTEAAKLGWIDAILTMYNYRLTKDADMQNAIDACYKAGVALTAMKTQGRGSLSEDDKKLLEHFSTKGWTEGQAKIKAVLEDERIASVNVGMNSVAYITQNVAAVLDKATLARDDKMVLEQYAKETCDGYCAGCSYICDKDGYISDVMRSLMYHNSYGDKELARQTFAAIPAEARAGLLKTDFSVAEARCPQHMPIARLMREAAEKLA